MDKPLTIEEVAEFLKVSKVTIYGMAAKGKLPGRKVGRAWRFSKKKLEEWLEEEVKVDPRKLRMVGNKVA